MKSIEKRIEENRQEGKKQSVGNVVDHAIIDVFGNDTWKEKREECLKSPRYKTLLAIASHQYESGINADCRGDWYIILKNAVKLVANNPNTRAEFKL